MTSASTKAPPPALTYDSDDSDFESDSDSSDSVTNVQLGLADGPLEGDDEANPLVSRIGGRVAWLPTQAIPPPSVATCLHCKTQMELLVQIFAPLEDSPYDRTLLAWGCARPACQRKGVGSLRVLRHLQFNQRWAAKLQKKKARQDALEAKRRERAEAHAKRIADEEAKKKINPFSASAGGAGGLGGGLFGGGFGSTPAATATTATPATEASAEDGEGGASEDDDDDDDASEDEDERLAEELAMKAALDESSSARKDWATSASSYRPPLYLNTVPEASSSARAGDKAQAAKLSKQELAALKATNGGTAANAGEDELKTLEKEGYEQMMLSGMDDVLEKFIARVGAEGRQVVRYEMGGQPLSFSAQGELYKALWPEKGGKAGGVQISRASNTCGPTAAGPRREYDPSRVPPCEVCGSKRTFELQLMPNLVNTLRPNAIADDSTSDDATWTTTTGDEDEQTRKRRELEAALGKALPAQPSADGITRTAAPAAGEGESSLNRKTGLCWSTVMVFVCEKDCCVPRGASDEEGGGADKEGETWREEWVGLQFEE